jgi:hypothetical protein
MTTPGPIIGAIFLFDAILIVAVATLVLRKDSGNLLNRIVAAAMCSFGIYLLFTGLIYTLPPIGFYLDLFQIFRDTAICGAIIAALLASLSGIILLRGEHYAAQGRVIIPVLAIGITALVLAIPFDGVTYYTSTDTVTFTADILGGIGVLFIPAALMAFTTLCYLQTLRGINRSNPKYNKAVALPIALILVTLGIAYYSVLALMGYPSPSLSIIGHAFYIASSFFFLYAFR